MKTRCSHFCSIVATAVILNLNALGQTSGGAGQPPPAVPPSSAPAPGTQNRQPLPPGSENRNQLPPPNQFPRTNQFGTTNQFGVSGQFGGTNQFADTNRVGAATQFGITNQLGTNASGITPTAAAGSTNRLYGTNTFEVTNQTTLTIQDQAFSQTDMAVLTRVREAVTPRLQLTGAWAPAVHFIVREGIVRLVGTVQTTLVRQEIESIVVKTPGVTRVINELVIGSPQTAQGDTDQTNATPQVSGSTTNLTPTGRTNSNLSPGLERREQLPPGLQKRNELPPDLSKRTNNIPGTTP